MKPDPVVSVLMTAFNRERYIAAAIESVLSQTFTDFELVVVDDRSTDRTVEVVEPYLRDPRVRLVVNERNLGDYPNRNRAAKLARGAFIKYHDSDDLMYPHCLATMVPWLEMEPRAGFALTTSRSWPGGPCPMLLTPRMSYELEFLGQGLFMGGPSSALFRTTVFHDWGGFPEAGAGSDLLLWLQACATVSVLLVPGDLFWYRVHPGQEIVRERAAREYAHAQGQVWRALKSSRCPLGMSDLRQARSNWLFIVARLTWRDVRAGRFTIALSRFRESDLTAADLFRYVRRPHREQVAGVPHEAADPSSLPLLSGDGSPERGLFPSEGAAIPEAVGSRQRIHG